MPVVPRTCVLGVCLVWANPVFLALFLCLSSQKLKQEKSNPAPLQTIRMRHPDFATARRVCRPLLSRTSATYYLWLTLHESNSKFKSPVPTTVIHSFPGIGNPSTVWYSTLTCNSWL